MSVVLSVLPALVPPELHRAAWDLCLQPRWLFGNLSVVGRSLPFWKMDFDGEPAINAVWQHARPTCEGLAERPLQVIRAYANGHTFGQGGQPHQDDQRPETYTLLYYPMLEWRHEWEGETMFFDASGEIARAVLPLPNRAVFFDSRIGHAGRPPSRLCPGLRVSIAFKLEVPG